MSWFAPAEGLSDNARRILTEMAESGMSESSGVADILNTIASNDEEQAQDEYLIGCAEEIRDAAKSFIEELLEGGE